MALSIWIFCLYCFECCLFGYWLTFNCQNQRILCFSCKIRRWVFKWWVTWKCQFMDNWIL